MREQRALTRGCHFFTTARSDEEGRFLMQLAHSRPDALQSINQRRSPSRWGWLAPPTWQDAEAEDPGSIVGHLSLRRASQGITHVKAPAFALRTTTQH
jgi:hypothetical protein